MHPTDSDTGWELFGRRAIRRGRWKALWMRPPEGDGRWQLYDLEEDPGEIVDLSTREPAILDGLLAAWDAYAERSGVLQEPVSVFEI